MGPEVLQKKLEEEVDAYKKIQKGNYGHEPTFDLAKRRKNVFIYRK